MQRMTRGVKDPKLARPEREALAVGRLANPLAGDREEPAVEVLECLLAVDRDSRRLETSRVDDVRRAAWVNEDGRVRQTLDESTGTPRVIEVNVRQEQPVDGVACQAELGKRPLDEGYRRIRPRIDDADAALALEDVDGGKTGTEVFRVNGGDAVRVTDPERDTSCYQESCGGVVHGRRRLEPSRY
jgi:hypothetical protein